MSAVDFNATNSGVVQGVNDKPTLPSVSAATQSTISTTVVTAVASSALSAAKVVSAQPKQTDLATALAEKELISKSSQPTGTASAAQAISTIPVGQTYIGQLNEANLPHGKGKLLGTLEYVEGTFSNGFFVSGKGRIIVKTIDGKQNVYEGELKNKYTDKISYKRHGVGIYKDGEGKVLYKGNWKDDIRSGQGTCYVRNDKGVFVLTGEFLRNHLIKGTTDRYITSSGCIYSGGIAQVFGSKETRYVFDGIGKATYPNGTVLSGEFEVGGTLKKGRALNLPCYDGLYTGELRQEYWGNQAYIREGEGAFIHPEEGTLIGTWRDNKLVKQKNGKPAASIISVLSVSTGSTAAAAKK